VTKLNAVEAQENFLDLLGRIREGETVLILERGRPAAKLVPAAAEDEPEHLANVQGWLEDDDPFFASMEESTGARSAHQPRVWIHRGTEGEGSR
jgi:prevent-host-death family protein